MLNKTPKNKNRLEYAMRIALILPLFFMVLHAPAQEKINNKKRMKQAEKQEIKEARRQKKEEENLRKQHLKIQSKATQKRMKKSRKKAKKNREVKGEPFYKKWFRKY
ncbi:MAG TPA: hypothetical protein DDX92_11095 [Flavobacteriales bacterium]|jgi:flagellar biosynthesis protein FliP|nr:hypothetical protein [Flavobacteriales bacterium]